MATVTFDTASRIYPGQARPAVDKLDLDAFEGRERDAHHRRRDLAHVLAVLVREDVVVGGDVDGVAAIAAAVPA